MHSIQGIALHLTTDMYINRKHENHGSIWVSCHITATIYLEGKPSDLMQQSFVPSIPPDGGISIPIHQRLRSVARDEYDIPLQLIRVKRNVRVDPPRYQLMTGRRAKPSLLAVIVICSSAARGTVRAFQARWRLDESQSGEKTLTNGR